METTPYTPSHQLRLVTAASLFDGHDASINIMRRVLQASGAEVIHLGHNRAAAEVVDAAVQEDVQAIALTSYQGGHVEYFKYVYDLLRERGRPEIRIFGGGGGTILPSEIAELHAYGIDRIYSPDDGRSLGLQGMINDLLRQSDRPSGQAQDWNSAGIVEADPAALGRALSLLEAYPERAEAWLSSLPLPPQKAPVLGITGTGGAGKSSLTDELVRRFLLDLPQLKLAVLSIDPSKRKTGGALLGDRIRMNAIHHPQVFMRSMATRQANVAISQTVPHALELFKRAGFDLILLETAGIGQSDSSIVELADLALYVMTPEFGAATQLEKIDMLDFADMVAINKFDRKGGADALRDVRKQYQRNQKRFAEAVDSMPVYPTIASQFNDPGTNALYKALLAGLNNKLNLGWQGTLDLPTGMPEKLAIIPPDRNRYLAEIAEESDRYERWVNEQSALARKAWQLKAAAQHLSA